MRNSDDCAANCNAIESLLHSSLTLGVQRRGCLQQKSVCHAGECLSEGDVPDVAHCNSPVQFTASRARDMHLHLKCALIPAQCHPNAAAISLTCTSNCCSVHRDMQQILKRQQAGNPDLTQLQWCLAQLQLRAAAFGRGS